MTQSSFYSDSELAEIGFARVGSDVRISRYARLYSPELMEIGDHSRIDDFCVISGRVTLGRNVHIAVHCNLAGGSEGVYLDDFAGLAYHCNIFAQSDDYSGESLTNPTVPAAYKHETKSRVDLGRHVIIGAGSMVFPGVNVAIGCSVAAMSLVNRSTEPWTVYAGIPAKPIKQRLRGLEAFEATYLQSEQQTAEPTPVEPVRALRKITCT